MNLPSTSPLPPSADQPPHRRRWWCWLAFGAALLIVAFAAGAPLIRDQLAAAIVWTQAIMREHHVWGAVLFAAFSALSAMIAFASSTMLVPPATLVWGKAGTFLLLWGGWLVGAALAFAIGRAGQPLLKHTGYGDKLAKYQEYVSTRMRFWVVLLFCIAIPSEIPSYLFGSMRYPFARFIAAMAIAESGYALAAVFAGESLLIDRPLPFLAIVAGLIAVALTAGLLLRISRKRQPGGLPRVKS